MGGRGASSGRSAKGKPYGTEYTTLYQSGNIKFVRYNDGKSSKTPQETMTKGRVYATVSSQNDVKFISYYDKHNKRYKQIDLVGQAHPVNGKYILPHTHKGANHSENGTFELSEKETKMVDRIVKTWHNRISKQ